MNRGPDRETAPVVERMRLRYRKSGPLRFSSHRDFQRAFERALRRAQVPIAYSAGFNPHPKVSYANAAATGVASEAEYVEIGLTVSCDPDGLRDALDHALPRGLDVAEVVRASTSDFAARLEASVWAIELPDVTPSVLRGAVDAFLAAESVEVERMTKSGVRTFDARPPVIDARVADEPQTGDQPGGCAILLAVVRHVTPSVRPDDVLAALRRVADLVPPVPPSVTRLAQGPLVEGGTAAELGPRPWATYARSAVGDPLEVDRVRQTEPAVVAT